MLKALEYYLTTDFTEIIHPLEVRGRSIWLTEDGHCKLGAWRSVVVEEEEC
jgi:hypothetical protein